MEVKYKLFPYPVLFSETDDYYSGSFASSINVKKDAKDIVFHLNFVLDDSGLSQLISERKADFLVHIECSQTAFRTSAQSEKPEINVKISEEKLCGKVSVCTFIIAKTDIINYYNDAFNIDYAGTNFDIEKGSVLALGQQVNVTIPKEDEPLGSLPSIFSVLRIQSSPKATVEINMDSEKLQILLRNDAYEKYADISKMTSISSIPHAVLIFPTLIYVFENIKANGIEGYEDRRWFRAINKKLEEQGHKLTEETIQNFSSFELSQNLLDMPIERALTSLKILTDGDDD